MLRTECCLTVLMIRKKHKPDSLIQNVVLLIVINKNTAYQTHKKRQENFILIKK